MPAFYIKTVNVDPERCIYFWGMRSDDYRYTATGAPVPENNIYTQVVCFMPKACVYASDMGAKPDVYVG